MGVFKEMSTSIINEGRQSELLSVLDNYFEELEECYPNTYKSLMKEISGIKTTINIDNTEELNMLLGHIEHDEFPRKNFWSIEDTTKVGEQIGINFNKWIYNKLSFNYVMNMVKSDYIEELTKMFNQSSVLKQTVLDNPMFYARLAKAWLEDEDAPRDKLIRYINFIVLRKDCM